MGSKPNWLLTLWKRRRQTANLFKKNEAFPGIEMVVCQLCGQYFKEIDTRESLVQDYIWEDIRTLPLNFATELWLSEHAKSDQIH